MEQVSINYAIKWEYRPGVIDETKDTVDDSFAYDKLAVDQASADPSDSFIPVEQIRPTESLLPTSDSFLPMESIRPTESLLSWDSGPNGNLSLLGTSDAFAQTDFHLI